mmetsp:Transcript_97278/g.302933  ORF Transcript_97278/g.302933 Transcript_97278/m.302933 type:complete len:205 (+) Transcript_97278:899-1513(+)
MVNLHCLHDATLHDQVVLHLVLPVVRDDRAALHDLKQVGELLPVAGGAPTQFSGHTLQPWLVGLLLARRTQQGVDKLLLQHGALWVGLHGLARNLEPREAVDLKRHAEHPLAFAEHKDGFLLHGRSLPHGHLLQSHLVRELLAVSVLFLLLLGHRRVLVLLQHLLLLLLRHDRAELRHRVKQPAGSGLFADGRRPRLPRQGPQT